MKSRISNQSYKPNEVKRLTIIEKIGISDSALWMIFIFLVICAAATRLVPLVSKTILLLAILDFFFSLVLLLFFLFEFNKKKDLKGLNALLDKEKFNNLCFECGLYTQSLSSSREINIPEIEITGDGFKLAALPGIATKTLESKDSFNDFLAQNDSDEYIINAYSGGDGWIYFETKKNFKRDGLKHEKNSE